MSEAKMIFKIFYGGFFVFYGYNLIDVLTGTLMQTTDYTQFSELMQTGFALLGLIFLFFKIVHYVMEMRHKQKMNKLSIVKAQQEIDRAFDQEYQEIQKRLKVTSNGQHKQTKGKTG